MKSAIALFPLAWIILVSIALAQPPPSSPAAPEPDPKTGSGNKAVEQSAGWQSLFDGKTLTGWKITEYGGQGEVEITNRQLIVWSGADLSGIHWTNAAALPASNYEIQLEAQRVQGNDFFCGLTFPVKDSFCTLILGGWGGAVVGLSSIDDQDASDNDTTRYMAFERERWYNIRLRVLDEKIQAWIDNEKIIDVGIKGRKISLRPGGIEMSVPLGLTTWQTTGAFRNVRLRRIEP